MRKVYTMRRLDHKPAPYASEYLLPSIKLNWLRHWFTLWSAGYRQLQLLHIRCISASAETITWGVDLSLDELWPLLVCLRIARYLYRYNLGVMVYLASSLADFATIVQTEVQQRAQVKSSDFSNDFSAIANTAGIYADARYALGQVSPALYTLPGDGLAQGIISLGYCALFALHYHPRCVSSHIWYSGLQWLDLRF